MRSASVSWTSWDELARLTLAGRIPLDKPDDRRRRTTTAPPASRSSRSRRPRPSKAVQPTCPPGGQLHTDTPRCQTDVRLCVWLRPEATGTLRRFTCASRGSRRRPTCDRGPAIWPHPLAVGLAGSRVRACCVCVFWRAQRERTELANFGLSLYAGTRPGGCWSLRLLGGI